MDDLCIVLMFSGFKLEPPLASMLLLFCDKANGVTKLDDELIDEYFIIAFQ
jgi:hypothetical protein